ncbi:hypothetical protein [Thalassoroseus pseudoceratinae]|uniref:hypothetical protein n=1 Tax=Thalassoroseus pseudoceratinae TaxID=2713176 RepID=UPI001422EDC4|nr:hypothetical protein [Thalassoroseus pseudoceratinae]
MRIHLGLVLVVTLGGVVTAIAGPMSWQSEPEGTSFPLLIRYRLSEEAVESPRVRVPELPSLSYPELPPTPDFSIAPAAEPLSIEENLQQSPDVEESPIPDQSEAKSNRGHWEIERRIKAYTPGRYSFGSPKRIWVSEGGSKKKAPAVKEKTQAEVVDDQAAAPSEPESNLQPVPTLILPERCVDCESRSVPLRPVADYPIPNPPITGSLPGPIKARLNYGLSRPVW